MRKWRKWMKKMPGVRGPLRLFLLSAVPFVSLCAQISPPPSRGGVGILDSNKPAGTVGSEVHKNLAITNGTTSSILTTVTGSGYVSEIFLASNEDLVSVTVTANNEAVPAINQVPIAIFLGDGYLDTQPAFAGRWITGSNDGSGSPGGTFRIPIPFSTSIQITLTNTSGSTATVTTFVVYHLGVPNTWPNQNHLRIATVDTSGITANTETSLLNVSSAGAGQLIGFGWIYDGFPGSVSPKTAPLEGAWKIYIDGAGTAQYQTSGSEDLFGMGWYFRNFTNNTGTSTLGTSGTGVFAQNADPDIVIMMYTNGPVTFGMQRFFVLDPITFTNSIKLTWTCGNTTVVSFTGTCTMVTTTWYYTAT